MHRRGWAALALTTIACQPIGEPPPLDAAPDDAPAAPAPAPPEPPPAPPPTPEPVAFTDITVKVRVLAHLHEEDLAELHALADRRLFISEGTRIAEVPAVGPGARPPALRFIKGPRVTPPAADGIFSSERLSDLGGIWPTLAIAATAYNAPRTSTLRGVFRRHGKGWRREKAPGDVNGYLTSITAWTDGRVLGLRLLDMYSAPGVAFTPELVVFGGDGPAPKLPADLRPHDLATTPAGDVFVLGARDGALTVLRYDTAGNPIADERLPEFRERPYHESQWFITATSADEAHVGGGYAVDPGQGPWTPYLASRVGGVWVELRTPIVGRIGSLLRTPDGSLWLTSSEEPANNAYIQGRGDIVRQGNLWRRDPDGRWSRVELTTDDRREGSRRPISLKRHRPRTVAARGDDLCVLLAWDTISSQLVCTAVAPAP